MGKRNRSNKSKTPAKRIKNPLEAIPCALEIHEAKEQFMNDLKIVYSKYLSEFENLIRAKLENRTANKVKFVEILKNSLDYQVYYKIDPSNEFTHIFYSQVNRFLNCILINIRNLDQMPQDFIISCISDAYEMLDLALKEIENVTTCLFSQCGIDCKSMSLLLFHEKLIKDRFVQQFWLEENTKNEKYCFYEVNSIVFNNFDVPQKKKTRKKKKKDSLVDWTLVDKEVEEFRIRLDTLVIIKEKIKPNISSVWIESLRKRLKERL
jgi:hypothetical protein